ncbi:asparagine synthetase B family protein [Aureibaculum luteum]|uniref:hypothetical protein n=1 Tax=Aureibaculum luteum TaxID=1548456 RepID=UPI000E483B42|nr:hypothetical protein [Aureibaculum luteum]
MGVFVLIKNDIKFNENSLHAVSKKKNLNFYLKDNFSVYTLHLFSNQKKKSNHFSNKKDAIYSVGTLIYKNQSYDDALKLYLNDFKNDCVTEDEIYGDFILIIKQNNVITIIREKCQSSKIFNLNNNVISNSFSTILFSSKQKFSINKQSVKENVLLGYILSPKTIVNEINEIQNKNNFENINFENFRNKNLSQVLNKKQYNEKEAIENIVELLNRQYDSIAKAFNNKRVDIGLSGGYDSRLNLILANHKMQIHPHSHYKERYDKDLEIAQQLCKSLDLDLNTKEIKPFINIKESDELEKALEDTFYYYDGRVALNTGFFNEIYSSKYREYITTNTELTLTGFGGEIFRNYSYQPKGKLSINFWIKNFVFSYYNYSAIKRTKENKEFLEIVQKDILEKLGIGNEKKISFATRRYYFSDIWTPMTYSVKSFAENQMSYFISPFISDTIKKSSYKMNDVIENDWNFQGKIINKLSPELAKIDSSYNFTFDDNPKLFEVKKKIMNSKYLLVLKNFLQKRRFEKNVKNNKQYDNEHFEEILSHVIEYLDGIKITYIKSSINWYYNVLSVALIIKKTKEHNVRIEELNN